ncbi:MAG TPA: hypothetical protein VEH52_08705 [Gaiellaceae bacterium]|nr:hypothetical protein [Gaiellaceae bacterium]
MGIVVRYNPVGVTGAAYDKVNARIQGTLDWPPEGLEFHVSFGEEGDLRVSEVWNSREQWEAWAQQIMPILVDEEIQFAGDPEVFEVHNIERP